MDISTQALPGNLSSEGDQGDNAHNQETTFLVINDWVRIVCFILVSINMLFGTPANGMVCWAVYKTKRLRKPMNMLVVNLMIADLLSCTVCSPVIIVLCLMTSPPLFVCRLLDFSHILAGCVILLTMTYLSFERYQAISKPYDISERPARMKIAVGVIWCIGVICATISQTMPFNPIRYICGSVIPKTRRYEFGVYIFVPLSFTCIIIIIIFYLKIFLRIRKHVKKRTAVSKWIRKVNRINPTIVSVALSAPAPAGNDRNDILRYLTSQTFLQDKDEEPLSKLVKRTRRTKSEADKLDTSKKPGSVQRYSQDSKLISNMKLSVQKLMVDTQNTSPDYESARGFISKPKRYRGIGEDKKNKSGRPEFSEIGEVELTNRINKRDSEQMNNDVYKTDTQHKEQGNQEGSSPNSKVIQNKVSSRPVLGDELRLDDEGQCNMTLDRSAETCKSRDGTATTNDVSVFVKGQSGLISIVNHNSGSANNYCNKSESKGSSAKNNSTLVGLAMGGNACSSEHNTNCNFEGRGENGKERVGGEEPERCKKGSAENEGEERGRRKESGETKELKGGGGKGEGGDSVGGGEEKEGDRTKRKTAVVDVIHIHDIHGNATRAQVNGAEIAGDICVMSKENREHGKRKVEQRTAKRAAIIVAAFLCCWFPLLMAILTSFILDSVSGTAATAWLATYLVTLAIALMVGMINPIVYGVVNNRFKPALIKIVRSVWCCTQTGPKCLR